MYLISPVPGRIHSSCASFLPGLSPILFFPFSTRRMWAMIYRACPIGFCVTAQGRVSQVCWYSRSKSNNERGGADRYGHKPTLPQFFFFFFWGNQVSHQRVFYAGALYWRIFSLITVEAGQPSVRYQEKRQWNIRRFRLRDLLSLLRACYKTPFLSLIPFSKKNETACLWQMKVYWHKKNLCVLFLR